MWPLAKRLIVLILVFMGIHPLLGQTATADTTRRGLNPRTALYMSIIPGGGQIYNHAWLKALLVIGAEGYCLYQFQRNMELYDLHQEPAYLEKRNSFAWWSLLAYIVGMMDAYVDAHLSTFPSDTTITTVPEIDQQLEEYP